MNDSPKNVPEPSGIEQAAAEWTLRIDRGLTASEQDEYMQWLAEDPRHRRAMAECQWGWDEFDRLAGLQTTRHAHVDPDLLKPEADRRRPAPLFRRRWPWLAAVPLAAAAALAVFVFGPEPPPPVPPVAIKRLENLPRRIEVVTLPDGSRVHLNHGAAIEAGFTRQERRVRLINGEANFQVTRDAARPFIVESGGVQVRAVGTAFNVRLTSGAVEVIVTEGRVRLGAGEGGTDPAELPLLEARQRGILRLDEPGGVPAIQVATLDPAVIERELAWQPRLLDFDAAPLPTIVDAFNRTNRVKLVVGDPALGEVVLSSAFWSDNVEGFVRLMESSFGLQAEWQGEDTIVLFRAGAAAPASR